MDNCPGIDTSLNDSVRPNLDIAAKDPNCATPLMVSLDMDGKKLDSCKFDDIITSNARNGVASPSEKSEKKNNGWAQEWFSFSQSTTLHGVCKITEDTPFTIRRILWVLVVILAVGMCCRQLILSILEYRSYRANVNIKINYNKTIRFPAITVCNQNDFRTSATAELEKYHLTRDFFVGLRASQSELNLGESANYSLADLYNQGAHKKEDLIVECIWDEQPCSLDDFALTVTDYGYCYTFNSGRNDSKIFTVSTTGADRGLRLLMNIEQYEYMMGPNPGAGIKLLVHDQNEVPLVRDLGQAIPPGSYAFVGLQVIEVQNLKPPHGVCNDSLQLGLFSKYSMSACIIECKQRYITNLCGCRDVYMPANETNEPPVCTMYQYKHCFHPNMQVFNDQDEPCDCPVPCERMLFDTSISYASTSNYDTEKLLRSSSSAVLKKRFLHALEMNQRVNEKIVKEDEELFGRMDDASLSVDELFSGTVEMIDNINLTLHKYDINLRKRLDFHTRWGVEKVVYIMHHDFVRGWDVMDERTFSVMTPFYLEVVAYAERAVTLLTDNDTSELHRVALYESADSQLFQRLSATRRAVDNITQVVAAYNYSTPLLTFKSSPNRRYDMTWITPEVVLDDREQMLKYAAKIYNRLDRYSNAIESVRQGIKDAFTTRFIDKSDFRKRLDEFRASVRTVNYYFFMFKERIVYRSDELAQEVKLKFDQAHNEYKHAFSELEMYLKRFRSSLSEVNEAWHHITVCRKMANDYIVNKDMKKIDLARFIMSAKTEKILDHLQTFFSDLKSKSQTISNLLISLETSLSKLWENMLSDISLKPFYKLISEDVLKLTEGKEEVTLIKTFAYMLDTTPDIINQTRHDLPFLMNSDFHTMDNDNEQQTIKEFFQRLHDLNDVDKTISNENMFFDVFSEVRESLNAFLDKSKIDLRFFRENFMQVDVFMKELSYEQIEQQIAYGLNSLWSDIGGTMGLFIGASVMTLFELFDVLVHGLCKFHCAARKGPKESKEHSWM